MSNVCRWNQLLDHSLQLQKKMENILFLLKYLVQIFQIDRFLSWKGKSKGSFIRVGDSDEPMTEYEVYSYEAYRKKISG